MCDCLFMEMITNNFRRICSLGICLLLLLLVSPVSNAQDHYTGKDVLVYKDVKYKITHFSFTRNISVENQANCIRDNLRYKIGSNPVVYYSDATGMGHFADSDSAMFNSIVREVFSEEEIRMYSEVSGSIYVGYVVDPDSGRVLETRFDIWLPDDDLTLLSIPIEKFWKLESLIKKQLVCHISNELKAERQSYTLSGDVLFSKNH